MKYMKYYINGICTALKCIDNFTEVCLFRLGIKKSVIIKTKTLGDLKLNDIRFKKAMINLILNFQKGCLEQDDIYIKKIPVFKKFIKSLNENNSIVELNGIKFINNSEILVLFEYFYKMGNAPFYNMDSKIIIDIGANIGDTALKFAKKNCEVYSFEPVPPIYENAIANINLNENLKDKIHLYNKAVSNHDGNITIKFNGESNSSSSSIFAEDGDEFNVESITLNEIILKLKEKNITPNLLHMDCEGSEFDIIPNSNLEIFDEVVIEHHQKIRGLKYTIITETLKKQNFEIKELISWGDTPFDEIGIIHAINIKK